MHVVQLRFKLKSKLNFFLVVFAVLSIFFLNLEPLLLLMQLLFLKSLSLLRELLHLALHYLFVVGLVLEPGLVCCFQSLDLLLELVADLRD